MSNPSFLLFGPFNTRIEDRPEPKIVDPHGVMVQIAYTGVCGSDVRTPHTGIFAWNLYPWIGDKTSDCLAVGPLLASWGNSDLRLPIGAPDHGPRSVRDRSCSWQIRISPRPWRPGGYRAGCPMSPPPAVQVRTLQSLSSHDLRGRPTSCSWYPN